MAAELTFPNGLVARDELVFGGTYGDQVSTEMTAVVLTRSHKRKARAVKMAKLAATFTKGGQPLRVLATETGKAQVIVVQDPSAQPILSAVGLDMDYLGTTLATSDTGFKRQEQLRVISTKPAPAAGSGEPYVLFPISAPFGSRDGSITHLMTHLIISNGTSESRTADAVAVAALHAAATNQPRAVVLILGSDPASDASQFSIAQVRDYLRSLRVPLIVWATGNAKTRRLAQDQTSSVHETPWGVAHDVSFGPRLISAVSDLRRELDAQWIAWIEGSHLPQDIELAAGTKGFKLAG